MLIVVGGISLTALVVGLTYWFSADHGTSRAPNTPSPAADVKQQNSDYTFTRSDQGHPVFTVHAARTVSYEESKATMLEDVMVQVYGPKGDRGDILRTHRCEYNALSGDFLATGPVQIEMSAHSSNIPGSGLQGKQRIIVDTSRVNYHQQDQLAQTDEPVKFNMGPASGTAQGMRYQIRDGWLELKHNVAVDLKQGTEKAPEPPIHLTASALRYDKDGGSVALNGPVEVTQGNHRAISDNAHIELDDYNRVSRINLEGHAKGFDANDLRSVEMAADHVRGDFDAATHQLHHLTAEENVVGESKSKGSISHLAARQFDMDFSGKNPQPLNGVARGDVHIDAQSQPVLNLAEKPATGNGPEKKALTAGEVHFDFRPDTHGIKDAETVGAGTLVVTPSDPKTGEKVITAGQFLMAFNTQGRIESLRGTAPTKVLFRPPAAAPTGSTTQQSTADHLDAVFDAGTQTLRELRQSGHFQYLDGDRHATADDAHFDSQTQVVQLFGHPEVWDATSRVKSQKMTLDNRTNTSIGDGKVQATHLRSPAPGAHPDATPPLPTNVLADKMVAHRQSQTIHYEGHVRAWQGTDVLESSALDVDRTQKRMSSGSQVATTFLQAAPAASPQARSLHPTGAARPVTVHADFLEYFDQGRRARYKGNVRMVTESTIVQSDRLDVYFTQGDSAEGSEVDHAEADGHVKVTQPGRVGTGDHGQYFAGPGKIILTGGPPVLVDEEKGSTTGQRLTFFIHDDRLFVDGGDQTPSLSKHRVAP